MSGVGVAAKGGGFQQYSSGFQLSQESHIGFHSRDSNSKMYSGKQIRGQVHTRFNPYKLLMKNGKRKADTQMQSACEGDQWKIGASHQKRRAVQNIMHKGAGAESSLPMVKKVDTFPFPRKHVGEECVCLSSFEDKIDQSVEETERSLSSVGSSSSYKSNDKLHSHKNLSNWPGVSSPFNDA